jgi:putative membrane protein
MTTTSSSDRAQATSGERRLHALSWLFDLTTHLSGLLLPAVALLVTARWTNIDILLIPAAIVVIAHSLVRQVSLRYEVTDTELVVRRNLIVHRSERHIPLARVHNLKTSATPVHRWLGVVEVAVETASGAEPEATLRVLSDDALAELRARVAASVDARTVAPGAASEPPAAAIPPIVSMDPRALVVWGLLNSRGLIIVGALAGVAWEISTSLQGNLPWDPRSWKGSYELARARGRDIFEIATLQSPLTIVLLLVAAFVLLKVLSITWALIWLHGFRVTRSASSLTVEHGLIPRISTVIPFSRIQRVIVRERPLLRLTGHVEVELMIVGGSAEQGRKEPVWLAPLLSREQLPSLLADIGVTEAPVAAPWQPLHPRAGRRMRMQMLIFLAVLSLVAWPIVGWRVALGIFSVLAPPGLLSATFQARAMRYAVTATHVLVQRGWLRRTLHLTWVDRVQVVALGASPFDRRHGMASVVVDTAVGGGADTGMQIPFLDAQVARAVAGQLATRAAVTPFAW